MLRPFQNFGSHTVEDDGKGNLTIKCEYGEQYTRTSRLGMFCDATDCKCERLSKEMEVDIDRMMNSIIDQFDPDLEK